MSRPRRLWCRWGCAALAVMAGLAAVICAVIPSAAGSATAASATAGPAGVTARAVPSAAAVRGLIPARAVPGPAAAAPDAARWHVAAVADGRGPSCAPGAPDHGGLPAVPPRTGSDHAQVPPARLCPEAARTHGTTPVRILVRGPDGPAPGPVELSVMRI
ncbi:hypothetical protein OG429_18750 [Streptomyces sp. NBC_00190]|uniref:hypothetical protein n=1 Tax=unclassified Streptomyces TaxID=2593676 RepID=UPI002E2DE5B1|nr:hypothetical protein [Streptomyces sp. NBC_00190]WSZ41123.1 hypothetical protein OG239_21450 [Streptomyces sp. NBC_00868]